MKLGIAVDESWNFFDEIFDHLVQNHDVNVFRPRETRLPILNGRANNYLFRRDFEGFLKNSEVVFFEWASEMLTRATGLPKHCGIVTRVHRFELYRWADRVNWDAVDRIIVVSNAKKEEFGARFPDQISKIVVIPEAISLDKFQFKPKTFNGDIGILCHLRPRKRVYELILAFSELAKIRDDCHLHIGGGLIPGLEEYHVAIHMLVNELELSDRITFYGRVTDSASWYTNIDIFISNSYSEGLQVSPMEAIASGCYCLAHHWDGADELLPGESLYFTNRELVSLIQYYFEVSPEEKEKRLAKQRERVINNFDVAKIARQINQVIEEVADERKG